ncbi:hypothetical protein AHAS_Ahas04G0198400 [Arachis hypogaea]
MTNEGSQHAPKFRTTMWLDGTSYTSQMTFSQKKTAEQDAARIALESLKKKIKDDRCPLDILISKSIMNEYAIKLNVEEPTYNTVQLERLLSHFMSFVIFNGTKYVSVIRKNKEDHKDKEVPMATNNGDKRIDVVPASSNTLSSSQELQMPTYVPCAKGPFPSKKFLSSAKRFRIGSAGYW